MDIAKTLLLGYPEAKWSLNGDTYDGLTWLSETPKPTEEELRVKWAEVSNPPPVVTMRSLRLEMTLAERQALDAGLASMPDGKDKSDALIYFTTSTKASRDSSVVASFAELVGATTERVDALFAAAKARDLIES